MTDPDGRPTLTFRAATEVHIVSGTEWRPDGMEDFDLMILRTALIRALGKVDLLARKRGLVEYRPVESDD